MTSPFFNNPVSNAFCHYQIDAARRLRIEVYEGRVGWQDMRGMFQAMALDPAWSPAYHSLVDLRAADLDLSTNEVLRLALMQRQDVHYHRGWRVYAISSASVFGMIRMMGKWSRTTDQTKIFQSLAQAEQWLAGPGMNDPLQNASFRHAAIHSKPAVAPLLRIG